MSYLDQFILEDVAKNCPREFMEYHKCISMNHDDPLQCDYRQRDLSKCIKLNVPSVQKVMKSCGEIMSNYEQCIRDNIDTRTINEKCVNLLKEMRACAEGQIDSSKRPINEMG